MKQNLLLKYKGTEFEDVARTIYNNDNLIRYNLSMLDYLDEDSLIDTVEEVDENLLKLFYDSIKILVLSDIDITEEFIRYRQTLQYAFISLNQELRLGISKLRTGKLNYSTFLSTLKKAYLVIADSIKTILLNPDKFAEIFKTALILYPVSTKVLTDLKNMAFSSAKEKEEKEEEKKTQPSISMDTLENYIQQIISTGNTDKWLKISDLANIFSISHAMAGNVVKALEKLKLLETKKEGNMKLCILRTSTMPETKSDKNENK